MTEEVQVPIKVALPEAVPLEEVPPVEVPVEVPIGSQLPKVAFWTVKTVTPVPAAEGPLPVFVRELCYFPDKIRVDETFTPRWTIRNEGLAGDVVLGFCYKDKCYALWEGYLESGQQVEIATTEPVTIKDFTMEDYYQTTTIEIKFLVGQLMKVVNEAKEVGITDNWSVAVLVEVPVFPIELTLLGVGVAAVTIGAVAVIAMPKS